MNDIAYGPDFEIDPQIYFTPPTITDGEVTENALYLWIEQLCVAYEMQMIHCAGMLGEFRDTYGHWDDNVWLAPGLSELMTFWDDDCEEEREETGAELRVVRDDSPAPADIPDAEEELGEPHYTASRFSWPEV